MMTKDKLQKIAEDFKNLDAAFKNFNSTMSSGPSSYYFDKMMGYYEGCMKAAKFQIGDRVRLKEDWNGDASGWQHCKHFLIEDNPGTVRGMDYRDGHYCYDIEFDTETWIDDKGNEHPFDKDRKHVYLFWQKQLKRL